MCGRPLFFPARLAEGVASKWVKSGVWTPEFLANNIGDSLTVKRASSKFFMYAEANGSNGMLPDSDAHKTDLVTLKPGDFFNKVVSGDPDGHRYYFTAPVMSLAPRLMGHVPEWSSLDLQESKGVEPWRCIRPYLSVWIGGKDVTTQAHYDVANNVFVQVWGEKEFWCYPPSATPNLHVFPDAHPRARKSQVDLDQPDHTLFPRFKDLPPPLKFVLKAGDALYIPPFWFHHVKALTPSISLNVFSESRIKLAAADAFQVPLPRAVLEEPDPHFRALAVKLFLRLLLNKLPILPQTSAQFLTDLLESRYKPLYHTGHTVHGAREAHASNGLDTPAPLAAPRREMELVPEAERRATERWTSAMETSLEPAATQAALHLEQMLADCHSADVDHRRGLMETVVGHLVELWAVRLLGAQHIYRGLS